MGCVGSNPHTGQKGGELPKGEKYQETTSNQPQISNLHTNVAVNQPEVEVNHAPTLPQSEKLHNSGKPILIEANNTLNIPSSQPNQPSRVHISYESSNNTAINHSTDPSNPQSQIPPAPASALKQVNNPEPIAELSQEDSNKIPQKKQDVKSDVKQGSKHKPQGHQPSGILQQNLEEKKQANSEVKAESNSNLPIGPLTHLTPTALPVQPLNDTIDALGVPPKLIVRNSVDQQIAQGLQQLDLEAEESVVGQEQYLQFWELKLPLMLVDLSSGKGQ